MLKNCKELLKLVGKLGGVAGFSLVCTLFSSQVLAVGLQEGSQVGT